MLTKQIGFGVFSFFDAGKPQSIESSERVQLSGTYNVRKGKLQLPVNRWTRRQVILCGTCLIVSSVKESQTGKMHILPLIGGKVHLKSHRNNTTTRPDWHRTFFFKMFLSQWFMMFVKSCFGSSSYHQRATWLSLLLPSANVSLCSEVCS